MPDFKDFYERHKANYSARAANGFARGMDDVRHKVIEEGWFSKSEGRQVTGNIEQGDVPKIEPAKQAEVKKPVDGRGIAPMHDTKFSYADWYKRQNPTGQPVAGGNIHDTARGKETAAADLYGTAPAAAPEAPAGAGSPTMHDEQAWNREVRSSDLYGPEQTDTEAGAGIHGPAQETEQGTGDFYGQAPAIEEPTIEAPEHDEPDLEPGH